MWLDDDGDDDPGPDPGSGPVPDPSTRHWRHPSELAAEMAAAAAGPAAHPSATEPSGGGTGSLLWPITVVGGSIAIAAFGVLGLYLLGSPGGDEIYAGGGDNPSGAISSSLADGARGLADPLESPGTELLRRGGAGADDRDTGDQESENRDSENRDSGNKDSSTDEEAGNGAATDDRDDSDAGGPAGPGPDNTGDSTGPRPTTTLRSAAPGQERSGPSATADEPVGPAIFASRSLRREPLASLVVTGDHLLTSASALAGRTRVFLRVNTRWFDAEVVASDLASDVAVVITEDEAVWQQLPALPPNPTPVNHGSTAYVGYCRSDVAGTPAAGPEAESDQQANDPAIEPEAAEDSARAKPTIGSVALPEPGCGLGANPSASAPTPGQTRENEVLPPTTKSAPKPPDGWDQRAEEMKAGDEAAAEAERRRGTVISTVDSARTLANRTIYDAIQTGIHRSNAIAGAPLRDDGGQIIGFVIGSSDSVISAMPIERAVATADSLLQIGAGSPAWLGVDGRLTSVGFEVVDLEPESPAVGTLEPGDVVLAVDGNRLQGRDHLIHLVRAAGVGDTITVSYRRPGESRTTAEVQIITRPG